ncbi:glycoside hydrolase family 43 protein [Knoellia sp. S7-12]|uniref:glycoside hydrolase family 43 protein n=1 Tax=Knoellia sp. S7-12 TaxID=3126698 RepID=UPI00336993C7
MSAALAVGVLAAGCGSGASESEESPSPTGAPSGGFANPVLDMNFPDPQIVRDGDTWVAIATNGNTMNVQTATSPDLVTWTAGGDALPSVASWSAEGKVWAPETVKIGDKWVMYYTTRAPDPEIQCLSIAVADKAAGPYVDDSTEPLVCESDVGGTIDASPFIDRDGTAYLSWKNDGNAVAADTWISIQELAPDGRSLVGKPTRLIQQDLPWEGDLVEASYLWVDDTSGTPVYHLFYSANSYADERYAVGHATATSPLGPFTKDPEPVLVTNDVAVGPGHNALVATGDEVWMVYHAWNPEAVGDDTVGRSMWLSRVRFGDDGSVKVDPPAKAVPQRPTM